MKTSLKVLALSALVLGSAGLARAAVETYAIDPVHSSAGFTIRHFVSKVSGSFSKVSGTIAVDRDRLDKSTVEASIDVGSISTANEKRDAHLKSPDFFDATRHTTITFRSTAWKKTGDDTFDVTGDLTIRGVTRPVVLKTRLLGFGPGPGGVELSGWEVSTTLNKTDFGVNGPAILGKALGDEVAVTINIEADRRK